MHFIKSLSAAAALYALGYAFPTESPSLKRQVDCAQITTFTTEFFLISAANRPRDRTCLFYTFGLTAIAQRFARTGSGLTTIWDIWPCFLYNGDISDMSNALRCIFANSVEKVEYFENMSRAMAMLCSTFAMVMTSDLNNIPLTGIWGTVELPTLQLTGNPGGRVDRIVAIDSIASKFRNVWIRPGTEPFKVKSPRSTTSENKNKELFKRQANDCYNPDQLEVWFGDIEW